MKTPGSGVRRGRVAIVTRLVSQCDSRARRSFPGAIGAVLRASRVVLPFPKGPGAVCIFGIQV